MKRLNLLFCALAAFAITSCATQPKKQVPPSEVEINGRKVQLLDYIQGSPYREVSVHFGSQEITYILKGEKDSLMRVSFEDAKESLTNKATLLANANFKSRNIGFRRRNPVDGFFYAVADEKNDEIYNLYRIDAKGELIQLTQDKSIYGWAFDKDFKGIYYAGRSGTAENTPGYLRYLDLGTGENKIIFNDSFETRMTRGTVAVSPDSQYVAFSVACNQNKDAKSLMLYSKKDGSTKALLDCKRKRTLTLSEHWTLDSDIIYSSDTLKEGSRIYAIRPKGKPKAISPRGWNTTQFRVTPPQVMEFDEKSYVAVIDTRPEATWIHLLTPKGKLVDEISTNALITTEGHSKKAIGVSTMAGDEPFALKALRFDGKKLRLDELAKLPTEQKNKMVACEVEKVSYETFDKLSTPWEKGRLHAYLYRPKNPAAKADQRLLVEGFYGGSNRFWPHIQFFCSLGYYVVSPVTRGAWDWGLELQNKIVGDLGGGETLDLFWAAREFSKQLDIPPERVGVFGYSHGGYETMRALTLPQTVNGITPDFQFGFGVAYFPATDLLGLIGHTNVPGWLMGLTGEDPMKNPNKWRDRSPITHAENAHGPIFIAHGVNDKRIEIIQSIEMTKALEKAGKPVHFVEMEGQGHGFKGQEALLKVYSEQIKFFKSSPR